MATSQKVAIFVWWLFWWLLVLTVWPPAILAASEWLFWQSVGDGYNFGERATGGCVAGGHGNRLMSAASCVSLMAVSAIDCQRQMCAGSQSQTKVAETSRALSRQSVPRTSLKMAGRAFQRSNPGRGLNFSHPLLRKSEELGILHVA
jgi:hypothetical protein